MHEQRTKIRDLPLDNGGEHPGFSIRYFRYHEGFALSKDGSKSFNIEFRHRHPHFEIFWFERGRGLIERDCENIEVGARTLLILGPGDVHNWKKTENLEGALLAVSEKFTYDSNFSLPFRELTVFLQPNNSRWIQMNPSEDNLIRNVFGIIQDTEGRSNFDKREVLKALLLILFSKINGFYVGRGLTQEMPRVSPLTRDFRQALLTECPRLASVKEFAQHLKVSRSYLHRAVLHDTGVAPSRHIRDRILVEAKRLLVHTNSSAAEVADQLGFRSASYFSSFFLRHAKVSPRAFRSSRGL